MDGGSVAEHILVPKSPDQTALVESAGGFAQTENTLAFRQREIHAGLFANKAGRARLRGKQNLAVGIRQFPRAVSQAHSQFCQCGLK